MPVFWKRQFTNVLLLLNTTDKLYFKKIQIERILEVILRDFY